MPFWSRIGGAQRLRSLLSRQSARCLHVAHRTAPGSRPVGHLERSLDVLLLHSSATVQFTPFRGISSAREKARGEKPAGGCRTNEEIDAEFVRLVTDEGHGIVSRRGALARARELDLDLVEVSREADPPVCKIMDYHKEKFKKQAILKERAKTKGDASLRTGDYKEVKFRGKIEKKDLQLKADTVKRLMERGYRVKVIAEAGKRSGSSDAGEEDLSQVLSRLYSLIEDFSAIESPPLVKGRMAYLIVRHAKFGTKKKLPKKTSEGDEVKDSSQKASIQLPSVDTSEQATKVRKTSETSTVPEHLHVAQSFSHTSQRPVVKNPKSSPAPWTGVKVVSGIGKVNADFESDLRSRHITPAPKTTTAMPSPELSNRYMKSGPGRNSAARTPSQPSWVKTRDKGLRDLKPCHSDLGNFNPQGRAPLRPPFEREQSHDDSGRKPDGSPPGPSSPQMYFGRFSTPKSDATDPMPGLKQNAEKRSSDKDVNPQLKDESIQRDWGIFSR